MTVAPDLLLLAVLLAARACQRWRWPVAPRRASAASDWHGPSRAAPADSGEPGRAAPAAPSAAAAVDPMDTLREKLASKLRRGHGARGAHALRGAGGRQVRPTPPAGKPPAQRRTCGRLRPRRAQGGQAARATRPPPATRATATRRTGATTAPADPSTGASSSPSSPPAPAAAGRARSTSAAASRCELEPIQFDSDRYELLSVSFMDNLLPPRISNRFLKPWQGLARTSVSLPRFGPPLLLMSCSPWGRPACRSPGGN